MVMAAMEQRLIERKEYQFGTLMHEENIDNENFHIALWARMLFLACLESKPHLNLIFSDFSL